MQERTQQALLRQGQQLEGFISDFVLFPSSFHGFLRDLAYRHWEKHSTAMTFCIVQRWFTGSWWSLHWIHSDCPCAIACLKCSHYIMAKSSFVCCGSAILMWLMFCFIENVCFSLQYLGILCCVYVSIGKELCWHGVCAIWRVTFAVSCCLSP